MEKVKHENVMCKESLGHTQGKVDMILELFMDSMTTDFSNQVVVGERTDNRLTTGKIQNATASSLPVYPQVQYLLLNQKSTQGNQKQKQKQISQGNND